MPAIRPTDHIGHLVSAPVATIRPTATLRQAAVALVADGVGLLVVVDPSGVRGVLSERDIVNAIAEDLDLDTERVRDVSSTDVLTVEEDASIVDSARTMIDAQIRHLAVARHGEVNGVVSIRDVLAVFLEDGEQVA